MFDIPYPNTRYAEALDYDQQLDYEAEMAGGYDTIEADEEREFAIRCRQSKVSATRLKKYETAYNKLHSESDRKLAKLDDELRRLRCNKTNAKARARLLGKKEAVKKLLEDDLKVLHDKYFATKKNRKP